jgi:DNA-binding HxlR family transcriptional regulator
MRRTSFAHMPCPIARALDAVGEWWSLLIIRECFRGVRRFDDFHSGLGIARNILASRLKALVTAGILEKRSLPEEGRRRNEYCLTPKGEAMKPILLALGDWGNRFTDGQYMSPDGLSGHEFNIAAQKLDQAEARS